MPRIPAVLIVEDDAGTRLLLQALVRRNDYRTVLAIDGEAAEEALRAGDYDAILLDLVLPKLDGRDLLQRIAATTPHLLRRIIVVTAAAPADYRDCAPIAEVRWVMSKPFELRLLEKRIVECCGERRRDPARVAGSSAHPARTA